MPKSQFPSNLDAEKTVLGSILLDEGAAATALGSLTENSFSGADERNVLIFRAMKELSSRKEKIDAVTLISTLENMHLLESSGGADYVKELIDSVVDPSFADTYIRTVNDTAILRDYLKKMNSIIRDYQKNGTGDIGEFLSVANSDLTHIAEGRSVGDFKSAAVVSKIVEKNINDVSARRNDKRLTGVDTGYTRLNDITHGWQKQNLIILAARTAMGKTAFALNLALNAAVNEKKTVAFFSLEMSSEMIMKRLLASVARVSNDHIATGNLNETEKLKITQGLLTLSKTNLYFDDTPNCKLGDLLSKSRKLRKAHPDLCLIVIDYLTLISVEGKFNSDAEKIGEITKSLKELARTLNVPIICLAQINREAEANKEARPKLSNLRGSGNIEQDADLVMLLYRSDYYEDIGLKSDPSEGMSKDKFTRRMQEERANNIKKTGKESPISITELAVAKNRNGQTGNVTLMFNKSESRFDNPAPEFLEKVNRAREGKKVDAVDISE